MNTPIAEVDATEPNPLTDYDAYVQHVASKSRPLRPGTAQWDRLRGLLTTTQTTADDRAA